MPISVRFAAPVAMFLVVIGYSTSAVSQDGQKPDLAAITEAWLASPHADRTAEAFTHWNEDGEVPGQCAVCHTATGIKDYLATDRATVGVIDHPVPLGSVVECATCHSESAQALQSVVFPSGATAEFGKSAICATCHQGRASSDSVTAAVAETEDDMVPGDLSFINIHYKAAAATQMGDLARGGYQYVGKSYAGPFKHVPELDSCIGCHAPHSTEPVAIAACATCHEGATEYSAIRTTTLDTDGDGDTAEGIGSEIASLHERLWSAIATYAAEVAQAPVVYDSQAYPYFFADTDDDGRLTAGEAVFPNRYQGWTPRMLKAAYNYQYVAKDTGAHAHNPHYAIQLLYDSLENLSEAIDVDMSGLARP